MKVQILRVQYKEALFIIERGWGGFVDFFSWHDTESWYPWGRDMGRTAFPGIPFAMAFIYLTLRLLGFTPDPLELAATLPVIYGERPFHTRVYVTGAVGTGKTSLSKLFRLNAEREGRSVGVNIHTNKTHQPAFKYNTLFGHYLNFSPLGPLRHKKKAHPKT